MTPQNGGKLAIVNLQETPMDEWAALNMRATTDYVLHEVFELALKLKVMEKLGLGFEWKQEIPYPAPPVRRFVGVQSKPKRRRPNAKTNVKA